jgi:hypothetical protein
MPLVGTMCCQDGKPHSFEHCMCEARAGRCEHPTPVLGALQNHAGSRKDAGISVSTLLGCPRQHYLTQIMDYHEDPERYYARWLGSVNHHAVEMGGPYEGVTQEQRFYKTVDMGDVEITVSGMPDWVDWDHSGIDDFKFVAYPPKQPYESHETQVNFYGGIIPDFELHRGRIHYFHGPAGAVKRRHTTLGVGVWTDDAVERWVRRRLSPHARYLSSLPKHSEAAGSLWSESDGVATIPETLLELRADDNYPWAGSCPFRGHGCCMD